MNQSKEEKYHIHYFMADATYITRVTICGRARALTSDPWLCSQSAKENGLQKCGLFLRPLATDAFSECEPPHNKTNKKAFVPSEDSDPPSLIRVFVVRSMGS